MDYQKLKKVPVALFLVKVRHKDGRMKNIEIMKLKEKLGTR